jgi:hypothetical protein
VNWVLATSLIVFNCLPLREVPVIDTSKKDWLLRDQAVLEQSYKSFCPRKFGEEAPCLKRFYKYDDGVYGVICGEEETGLK